MGAKIYVGGLPYATTDEELSNLFSTHGTVQSARVITDKFTGRSRGFAFVEMPNDDEAKKAMEQLNGSDMDGRKIVVNVAEERKERSDGGGGGFRGGNRGGGGGGGGGYRGGDNRGNRRY